MARKRRFQEIEPHRTPQAAEKIFIGGELVGGMSRRTAELSGKAGMGSCRTQAEQSAARGTEVGFHNGNKINS
jgi:hypothetical protein